MHKNDIHLISITLCTHTGAYFTLGYMKYKNIDAMLHNFGHSFVSLMNYVDGEYIIDELNAFAKLAPGYEICIDFSSGMVSPSVTHPERLRKSIGYWMDWLPKHMKSHNIDPSKLGPVTLRFRLTSFGIEIVAAATDDRGIHHEKFVRA